MAGYVMRQFTCPKAVTHPSTNRARCRSTALIETNALPLCKPPRSAVLVVAGGRKDIWPKSSHAPAEVLPWCTSGYAVECQTCNREVAGSNLGRGYFTPRSTQPSIPPGSVNKYQLRLGRQRQVSPIPIADERVGVQLKL